MARFFKRDYPSANSIWLDGAVLVDPGTGWDGERPQQVVNTHWHSDHSGGNAALQAVGVPILAEATEAALINAGHPDACRAHYLRQRVTPYRVDRSLSPGDELAAGDACWTVLALPGHSADQIGLWNGADRILIAADALAAGDIGWLDLDADPDALGRAEATVERIAGLAPRLVLPGHGPAVTDPAAALASAQSRLASWRADPRRIAFHACKRIFVHALMIEDGLDRAEVEPYLLGSPWFSAHASRAFGLSPGAFMPLLLDEVVRSGAAAWTGERLVPGGRYRRPYSASPCFL